MLLKHLKLPHQTLLPPISKVLGYLLTPSWMKGAHGLMYRRLQCDFCFLTVSTCVLWCLARSLELLNAFWQPGCWQRYGFSPVWLLKWILRFSSLEKAFLHPSNYKREIKNTLSKLQQQAQEQQEQQAERAFRNLQPAMAGWSSRAEKTWLLSVGITAGFEPFRS